MKKFTILIVAAGILLFSMRGAYALQSIDVTGDGRIDALDIKAILTNWLMSGSQSADIDENGKVNSQDAAYVLRDFGTILVSPSPSLLPSSSPQIAQEWSQHAHDAQHTSYSTQVVATPWKWKWSWNGPNATGGISSGKTSLPRNMQPVTGGGRVYVARGSGGVVALNETNGAVLWTASPGGAFNSTVAYDADTNSVFAVSANGRLYKLNANTGTTSSSFAGNGTSPLPLPPGIYQNEVFFSMGSSVYALNKTTMQLIWTYAAGSPVHTPPAYSPSRNRVIVATQDLYVHAINNANGQQVWRVKHTTLSGGDPGSSNANAEVSNGWPVIAEEHGYALIKLRLNWQTLWETYQPDNTAIRQFLSANPVHQALQVIDLDDGSKPFIANIGHGGFGDGGYMPMGFQPAVKKFSDGSEVAYVLARGGTIYDPRWDSHLGELMLDDTTIPGFQAGYFRFISFASAPISGDTFLTDEQPFISAAGDYLFANHWEASMFSLRITDRSAARGLYTNQIQTQALYTLIESQDGGNCNNTTHFVTGLLQNTRGYANPLGGFHIYCNLGNVYDSYWTNYAGTVISNGMIIIVSTSGCVVALESGSLTGFAPGLPVAVFQLFGQIGETLAALSQTTLPVTETNANSVIDYTEAQEFIGQTKTVTGTTAYIFNNGKSVLLGFADPHQGYFKIQIPKNSWEQFGSTFGTQLGRNKENLFTEGKTVKVTGKIVPYQGDPVIYVSDPTQLDVMK